MHGSQITGIQNAKLHQDKGAIVIVSQRQHYLKATYPEFLHDLNSIITSKMQSKNKCFKTFKLHIGLGRNDGELMIEFLELSLLV